MHANKKNSNGVHFGGCTLIFFQLDTIICKSKFTLAFKVVVKQLQVVVHAAGNATFALSGQQNLLEINRE